MHKSGIDCLLLEGPVPLPALHDERHPGRHRARAWFLYESNEPYSSFGVHIVPNTLEQSFSLLRSEVEQIPESTRLSLVGFSQGAVLVYLLACSMRHDPRFSWLRQRVACCIMMGGFCARPTTWSQEGLADLSLPSFHMIGLNDTRVPPEISQELVKKFRNPIVLEHDKGHVIPQSSACSAAMIDFILTVDDKANARG